MFSFGGGSRVAGVPTVLLVVGIVALLHTVNAFRPSRNKFLLAPSFFASWLTIELAGWWLFWEVVAGIGLVAAGGLESTRGWIGLGCLALAAAGLVAILARARGTSQLLQEAMVDVEVDPDAPAPMFPRHHVWFPFLMNRRRGIVKFKDIVFAEGTTKKGTVRLRLDVVAPADARPGDKRPGLLQIHGGAWVIGDKREQALPLLGHLAANGWVAINANYRLSPAVGYPEHLIDCKRAIAWWREHADEYGGDPDFLCVTGGSAGGHLCALVGLTANDPRFQPGFEDVDTTVRAAVPFYGIYDFTNRNGHSPKDMVPRFLEPIVMQRTLAEDPEAFAAYSPLDQVRPDAPPFFVIHGDLDVLAPVEDARLFVQELRKVSSSPVLYAELRGAQHAFEVFPSHRAARVVEAVQRYLESIHRAWRDKGEPRDAVVSEAELDRADAAVAADPRPEAEAARNENTF